MYPKTFTHRNDPNSSVVIMSAEQEAQLPAEYLPPVSSGNQTISGEDAVCNAMLSPEYEALLADREKLEADRAEFAAHMADQEKSLSERRDELTEGYKGAMADLEADRAALAADRQALEDQRQPVEADAASGPAKRVRTAKAE